jgi:hypothetical protein
VSRFEALGTLAFESAASASSATPGYFENSTPCGGTQASLWWHLLWHRCAGVL